MRGIRIINRENSTAEAYKQSTVLSGRRNMPSLDLLLCVYPRHA